MFISSSITRNNKCTHYLINIPGLLITHALFKNLIDSNRLCYKLVSTLTDYESVTSKLNHYFCAMKNNPGTKRKQGSLRIFGIRAVMEAIEAGKEIDSIYIRKGAGGTLYRDLKKIAVEHDLNLQTVPPEKLRHLGDKNHQGVAAFISPVVFHRLELLVPEIFERGEVPLILILDRITDVRNFGAICRSAECMGVHGILIPRKGAAQVNADAVKTSAGALLNIPLCRERNLKHSISYLRDSGLQVIACTEKADKHPDATDFSVPTAIILGSEEDGISGEYLKLADEAVSIPMKGSIASLNVSVAAGVIFYETLRQRLQAGQA